MKPEPIGTVWTATARVRYIDDAREPPRWVTVARCIDTPLHVREALAKARAQHPGKTLWVHDIMGERIAP